MWWHTPLTTVLRISLSLKPVWPARDAQGDPVSKKGEGEDFLYFFNNSFGMKQPLHCILQLCISLRKMVRGQYFRSVASLQTILNVLSKRQELTFTGPLKQAWQTLNHNSFLRSTEGWRTQDSTVSVAEACLQGPPFPPSHTCGSQKEQTILLKTLQSQYGLCPAPAPSQGCSSWGTFSARVWYITLLSRNDPNLLAIDPY